MLLKIYKFKYATLVPLDVDTYIMFWWSFSSMIMLQIFSVTSDRVHNKDSHP